MLHIVKLSTKKTLSDEYLGRQPKSALTPDSNMGLKRKESG